MTAFLARHSLRWRREGVAFLARHSLRWRREGVGFMAIGYLTSLMYALAIVLPIFFLAISSFKDTQEILRQPLGLPSSVDLGNYRIAIEEVSLLRAMTISVGVTTGAEILTLLLAFPAAYAIGRIKSRFSRSLEVFFGLGFLIPVFAILLPVFLMAAATGLLNNPVMLILFYPATRLPVSIFILATYIRQIPSELEESATIDGATRLQLLWHIFLPLARPGIITVVILSFVDIWNEYIFALVLLSSENRTAQVAVPLLQSEHFVNYELLAAGSIVTLVPVYIVFIIFQRRLTSGFLAGAVRG